MIERVPYKLDSTISLLQMYIILFLILASLIEIKYLIETLRKHQSESAIRAFILKNILRYYVQALARYQEAMLENILVWHIIDKIKRPVLYFFNQNYATVGVTLYLFFYARIIITISLCIDIYYMAQIYIFYKMLYLLILPLIVSSILSLLKTQSTTILHQLETRDVTITHNNLSYEIQLKPEMLPKPSSAIILNKCHLNLEILNLVAIIEQIKTWHYFLLIQITLSIIFCGSWTFAFISIIYKTEL